jgi:hypothetical protein
MAIFVVALLFLRSPLVITVIVFIGDFKLAQFSALLSPKFLVF